MRKFYIAFLPALFFSTLSFSQHPVTKVAQKYFRSDPYVSTFSSFLKHLLNDPSITQKTIEKRTDTSLFYFRGTYTNYNPFFFKPTRVEVILTEMAVSLDSAKIDTVYTYQLLAYNNDTKEGIDDVKKEFEKIYRKHKSGFSSTSFGERHDAGKPPNATYNFFDNLCAIAPFAVTWAGPNEKKETILVLTLRMSIHNNQTTLPVPFYTFKVMRSFTRVRIDNALFVNIIYSHFP